MKKAYFYGNEVSDYGVQHGLVDYACFAKAFDAVLNCNIIQATAEIGYWEPVCGSEEYYEDHAGHVYDRDEAAARIAELEQERDELRDEIGETLSAAAQKRLDEIDADLEWLEDAHYYEVFQWYIVSDNAVSLLEEAGEIVYYNEALDMYVWGVTHWGTSWTHVLTAIPCHVWDDEKDA